MTAIHVLHRKIPYQKFSHTHNHLHYTFQFVINISQTNNTVSRGQLTAIECTMQ